MQGFKTCALAVGCLLAAAGSVSSSDVDVLATVGDTRSITAFELAGEVPGSGEWGLDSPQSLAVDHRGDMLIADSGNNRVLIITETGDLVVEFGGYGWDEGQFDTPTDLAVYPGFYIYVLDEGNRRVERFDERGNYLDRIVDEDETGTPIGIAIGSGGELLIVDEDKQAVIVYSQFAETLEPLGGFGGGVGELVSPCDVAMGPSRQIAVSDPGAGVVHVFDEFGSELCEVALPGDGFHPCALAFDTYGNLIAADPKGRRIVAFSARNRLITAVAIEGSGLPPAVEPVGLAIDGNGRLLVLDRVAGRLIIVDLVYGACE
jgi:DNA-binding beta-propeller fold protein YncE